MPDPATATALAQAADQLRASAKAHKRASAAHRRHARDLMAALDQLRGTCDRLGIELVIDSEASGGMADE